jgi:hypothetical protein
MQVPESTPDAVDTVPTAPAEPEPTASRVASRVRARHEGMSEVHRSVVRLRSVASRIIKTVATVAGCCLIAAAILIAVKANPSNSLVSLIKHLAEFFDLGFFSLTNPIKQFTGSNGAALTALLNYGIGAVVWFVVGGFIAALVRGSGSRR